MPIPAAPSAPAPSNRLRRSMPYAAWCLAAALALVGCGASNPNAGSTTGSGGSSGNSHGGASGGPTGGRGGAGRGGFGGGTSGLIAAVEGRTLQVQTPTQQTAVVYTTATRITRLLASTAAALKVGECVTALPARPAGAPAGGPRPTMSPTTSPTPPSGPVEAATVQLRAATRGSCDLGGRPGGDGGPDAGTPRPTGTRTAGPSGGASNRGGFGGGIGGAGFGAFGTIASVGQGSFTVTEAARAGAAGSTAPRTVTVKDARTTVFLLESQANAAAIKVGECARATGRPDDTGTVTATALTLSPATNGTCAGALGAGRA